MRTLTACFALASIFFLAACSDDEPPNDIPRTVPPVSDGAASAPVVRGVGPTIEALAFATDQG